MSEVSLPEFFPEFGFQDERDSVNEILPRLFLTNFRGAADLKTLQLQNISCVVCVNGAADDNPHPKELAYLNIEGVEDEESHSETLCSHLKDAGLFIHQRRQEGKGVVVHCAAGISRSSTIVLFYLMQHEGMSLRGAFVHLKSKRRIVWPNCGLMKVLGECEAEIFGLSAPTISPVDYGEWSSFDIEAYNAAKEVDRL